MKSLGNYKSKYLPPNFANDLLNCEMEVEVQADGIDLKIIQRLIELYMQGMEYYEAIGDTRFVYFKRKMDNLLINPNVLDSMQKKPEPPKQERERLEQQQTADQGYKGGNTTRTSQQNNSQSAGENSSSNSGINQTANGQNHLNSETVNGKQSNSQIEFSHKISPDKSNRLLQAVQAKQNIKKNLAVEIQSQEEHVKAMVRLIEQDGKTKVNTIQNELSDQNQKIRERIQRRKERKMMTSSSQPTLHVSNSQSDCLSESPNSNMSPITIDFGMITSAINEDEEFREDKIALLKSAAPSIRRRQISSIALPKAEIKRKHSF